MTSWHILKTRTNRELSIHDFLDKEGISCYTPFDTRILRSSHVQRKARQRTTYIVPVFTGYLFFNIDIRTDLPKLSIATQKCKDIYGIIMKDDSDLYCIKDDVIDSLRVAYPTGYIPNVHIGKNRQRKIDYSAPRFVKGQKVRFKAGPLQGIDLTVDRQMNDQIDLLMEFLSSTRKVTAMIDSIKV